MYIEPSVIQSLQEEILIWYENNQRDLPWRRDRDPYHILVSEIMSQQTQIIRVIPKYEAWLIRFPTIQSLAVSETSEVLRYWSGLGYNRRALYLHKAAQIIVSEHDGVFPQTVESLMKLPGIGEYTASAIACFAFDAQIAVVDTNVRKVILKKVLPDSDDPGTLKKIATLLIPTGQAYVWNQALMDYASAVLKHEKIPIPKQSPFKGSNRYYRGQVVKLLLTHNGATITYLGEKLSQDEEFMEKIIQGLEKDGIIRRKNQLVYFA